MGKKVIYVGHRGSKIGNAVENTLPAYIIGAEAGYQALETDVRVTKDGVYIVSHDPDLTRLTIHSPIQYNLDVNQSNYDDIKDIELSEEFQGVLKTGCKICLFDEYLDVCAKYRCIPIIELKWTNGIYASLDDPDNHDYSNLDGLIKKVYEHHLEDIAVIMTSMIGCLEYVHEHYPNLKLQWLCAGRVKEFMARAAKSGMDIDVEYVHFDEEVEKFCKEHNQKVNIWTLDDESLLQGFLDRGVDFVTTNVIRPR